MGRMSVPIVLLAAWACAPAFGQAPSVGDKAPTISAPVWENLPDGMQTLTQKDLKGRILLVDFWATW